VSGIVPWDFDGTLAERPGAGLLDAAEKILSS
jgi:hypothetical protein